MGEMRGKEKDIYRVKHVPQSDQCTIIEKRFVADDTYQVVVDSIGIQLPNSILGLNILARRIQTVFERLQQFVLHISQHCKLTN